MDHPYKLSILIITIPEHAELLKGLRASLDAQPRRDEVEIIEELTAHEKDGGPKRGFKRNMLMYKSRGEYISYIDADDRVSDGTEHPAYISSVLEAIESGPISLAKFTTDPKKADYLPYQGPRVHPDCVGIEGEIRFGKDPRLLFMHSMQHSIDWWDDAATAEPGKARYYRTPNHLNPVLRSLAMKARFDDQADWSEDHDYGRRLHRLIMTETYIPYPIYYYIKP